jgi:hypothetical protein
MVKPEKCQTPILRGDFLSFAAIVIGGGRGKTGTVGYALSAGFGILQSLIPSLHGIVFPLVSFNPALGFGY